MTFDVKPGVEVPSLTRREAKYPFATMEVGGRFFVPGTTTTKFSTYASAKGKQLDRRFSTQTQIMRQDLQTDQWEPCDPKDHGAKTGVLVTRLE